MSDLVVATVLIVFSTILIIGLSFLIESFIGHNYYIDFCRVTEKILIGECGWLWTLCGVILLNILEEIVARWLFVGYLPKFFGPTIFWAFLIISNGLWTWSHIFIYEPKDRHIIVLLPLFIIGFVYAYFYLMLGLVFVILSHIATNLVLWFSYKLFFSSYRLAIP